MILAPEECGCPIIEEGPTIINSSVCSGTHLFMVLLQAYLWGRCDISTPCRRIESVQDTEESYDFIVVGGGSSGSIVAGRLSEDNNNKVLLIEAGGPEPLGVRIPSFYRMFWGQQDVDWRLRTVPSNYCLDQEGKGCNWPLGKGIGGCSLLNGMMFHKGHPADYDDWVALGATGWSWEEVKKYMDKIEGNKQVGTRVNGEYHSTNGSMPIQTFNYQPPELSVLLQAINDTGLPVITDMNDPNTPEGFNVAQTFNDNGQRQTTARVYLRPTSERPNINYKLNSHVTKVLFESNKAVGVEYIDKDGNTKSVKANKEVILCAGPIHSPQILMLSGVGPKETLEPLNIPVVADLPVGKNLKNHCGATLNFILSEVDNVNILDWNAAMNYLLRREGPMSSTGLTQLTGLLYSSYANRSRAQPDLQFFFNGMYAECSKSGLVKELVAEDCPKTGYNITANAVALLPRSVGVLTINSTDPLESPILNPNFFSHPDDIEMIKDGLKYLQRIFNSELLQKKYKPVLDPEYGAPCNNTTEWSNEWMECMILYHTDPQNHQLGTNSIGQVVDPNLRVYGLQSVRVCDAGVMPSAPTGNPQGAIMVVAEKCADLVAKTWQ